MHAFCVTSEIESLAALEDAMKAMPGVYLTTQVRVRGIGSRGLPENEFTNPAWPAALGTARRDRNSLRVQVIALIKDEGTA